MADSVFQAFKNNKITLPEFQPKLKDANLAHNMLESRGGGSVSSLNFVFVNRKLKIEISEKILKRLLAVSG